MRRLLHVVLLVCAANAWAIEKIVCFPDRINADPQIETKLRAAIAAGADGVVLNQWSKEVPFTDEARETRLISDMHHLLDICDSAHVKVWLASQVSSKYDYGDPCAIPLKQMSGTPVQATFAPAELHMDSAAKSQYVQVQAPPSHLYSINVNVIGNSIQMIWMRDTEYIPDQHANVVRVTLDEGEHHIECPALDDTDRWMLVFRRASGPVTIRIESIAETSPKSESVRAPDSTSNREGWYNYLGVPKQGFTWGRSARFENDAARRKVIERNCAFLSREFGRHPSVVGSFNWSDEWPSGGHDWSFQRVFPNAGAGFAAELNRWAEIQQQYFKQPGLAFGDMFYREGKYSRACSARGGGFTNALSYLPKSAPIELIAWDDITNPRILLSQVAQFHGRTWAVGVYMEGNKQSQTWRRVYDQYRGSPKPTKVVFFGWDHSQYTEEHLRAEFAEWK